MAMNQQMHLNEAVAGATVVGGDPNSTAAAGSNGYGRARPGKRPRVSIGMPVRNGERFIRQAIDSLLNQTFTDFELIICDNASTDSTENICREYAAADPRVRYYRNPRNVGPAGNHNKCFNLCRGEYFRWHAHDDLCTPDYLAKCVEALDQDSSVVIAYPQTLIVGDEGQPLDIYNFRPRTDQSDPAGRFGELVLVNHRQHRAVEIFGLMRSSALCQTPLEGAYARGDSVLLARMALLGRFIELPERLFLSRSHTSQSMQTLPASIKNGRSRLSRVLGTGPLPPPEWWDTSRKGKANFPEWNLLKEYWTSIGRTRELTLRQRLRCHAIVFEWFVRNTPKLVRDVLFASEMLLTRVVERIGMSAAGSGRTAASSRRN
jgi:glycosyltransferase involved in cell wall biosynthesis